MMNALINRYRQRNKSRWLNVLTGTEGQFAFMGVGMHSMQNLYPVLHFLGVNLKWIHSRTLSHAEAMAARFPGAKATTNPDDIFSDNGLKGVFICTHPAVQHTFALRCVNSGKACWVEKPIARNSAEWKSLYEAAAKANVKVMAGHQRRFAPAYTLLKQKVNPTATYHLQYRTGAYPEGDLLSEVLVHPLDLITHLFGTPAEVQVQSAGAAAERRVMLLTKHQNGAAGTAELSAYGSWKDAAETLTLETDAGLYSAENFRQVTLRPKPGKILGIPSEKIKNQETVTRTLFSANGFLPGMQHNELVLAGFYDSIRSFALGESGAASIEKLGDTFALLDTVRGRLS